MVWLRRTAIALALAGAHCAHAAEDYAGVVKTTRGSTFVERAGENLKLVPGMRVSAGDSLVTGADGYLGLTMRDDTLLTLGPRTTIGLENYRFDPKTHDGNTLVSMTRGVLSVVTGLIAKRAPESFVVKTRVSTMGVRGTEFIVEVDER